MLSLRTTLLLLGAAALALATPTPGEIKPSQNRPNDPSWYCQWKRRVVYDRYSLEGRGWGVSEGELKKAISKSNGAITGWKYNENDEGGFEAAWNLPLSMHHNVEDKLNQLIDSDDIHGVICHDI